MKKIILLLILCLGISTMFGQVTFTQEIFTSTGGRAIVDMNNDDLDDIVGVSATNIKIHYQLEAGGFNEINITTTQADYPASWSLAAADYDSNGYTDLLYGAGQGVTFMRANDTGTAFTEVSGPEYVFSQRSNFIDINNDGHLDAFVCHDVAPNVYYLNDGDGNLTFHQGGLGDYPSGGNYGSVWIDYDNDGDMDMFIAKCGGEEARRTNQMHRNNGDGTFTEVAESLGLDDPMQTWSSAWADYDNDGDMDVFVGASTGTHKMMMNNGDNTFTDVTDGSGLDAFTINGTENTPRDFDNDGNADIVSNGAILYGNGDLTFTNIEIDALPATFFGDLNNDGFVDGVWFNTIYYNDGNANNWISLTTRGIGPDLNGSNRNGIGARIEVVTTSGVQIRDVRIGEGFSNSSSANTHFGIGSDDAITTLTIRWPSGIIDVIENPAINESHVFIEGENILNMNDFLVSNLILYPNPTNDVLNLNISDGFENTLFMIYDSTGRRVLNSKMTENYIDVSNLSTGNYLLRIVKGGTIKIQKFIKK